MPVHTPGRRAGSGAALRQVKRAMENKASRSLFASLNLTSMVDFMSVVVIFLLMNFSASGQVHFTQQDIVIPQSTQGNDLERVPVIGISRDSITVEGDLVESSAQVSQNPDTYNLETLTAALKKQKDTYKETHPGVPFDHKVIVQADQGVPFKLVRRVIDTAGQAGYNLCLFAIRKNSAAGGE